MELTPEMARRLCLDIVNRLDRWPSLDAALRTGGVEVKASGLIAESLDSLATELALRGLREYRNADYVFFAPDSGDQPKLQVKTVFEVKFNYAKQTADIGSRLNDAFHQAQGYQRRVGACSAYVLYLVAAPSRERVPAANRDTGWKYWNAGIDDAIATLRTAAARYLGSIVGESTGGSTHPLYCALIRRDSDAGSLSAPALPSAS